MSPTPLDAEIPSWLSRVLAADPPGADVVAYTLGLFETEDGYCAHVSGSTTFDSASDGCALEPAYRPSGAEFPLFRDAFSATDWKDALARFRGALSLALARPELAHSVLAHSVLAGAHARRERCRRSTWCGRWNGGCRHGQVDAFRVGCRSLHEMSRQT